MKLSFTKMQGAGNDYIYFDGTKEAPQNLPELAVKLSDRHFGIGGDGIVVIAKSQVADFKMIMLNNDGSYAEMCGNASRCIGKYVYDFGLTKKTTVTLETLAGVKTLELVVENEKVKKVRVNMGRAVLDPKQIPVLADDFKNVEIKLANKKYIATCVSMGNPHAVIFVDDTNFEDFFVDGKAIESHSLFPKKTNVEFCKIMDKDNLEMRVFERGTGETLACGTGASATLVAAYLNGLSNSSASLHLRGGDLFIEYIDGVVYMTGGAEVVFQGEVEI